MENSLKYYAVTAKCGHVGMHKYLPFTFGVKANNGKEAAAICRGYGRVKHDHKDAILNCIQIDYEEYKDLMERNWDCPYLTSQNVQEQNRTCEDIYSLLEVDHHNDKQIYSHKHKKGSIKHKIRRQELYALTDLEEMDYELSNYYC